MGTDGAAAEVEVVRLLAEALATLEVPAWRLVFGSVTPLTALLSNCSPSPEFSAQVLALVHDSDLVSLDELVALLEEPGEPTPPKRRQSRAKASADEWERACAEWGLRPDDSN